jgi:hypothetical protein
MKYQARKVNGYACVRDMKYQARRVNGYACVRDMKYQVRRVNSYACVRNINFASVSTIYTIYFGTLHTMWYFLLCILLTNPL